MKPASAEVLDVSCIWICPEKIKTLPIYGLAWERMLKEADRKIFTPDLSDQNDNDNVGVLAKALVYVRTGEESYRQDVLSACRQIIGTESEGRTLALGRELMAYVIAAGLVGLPENQDQKFRNWLGNVRDLQLEGRTLRSTHEKRPNNWGTHAGASRLAIAFYLNDNDDLTNAVKVFKGWLGDYYTYSGFKYRELHWQADPLRPVGINPAGAMLHGHSVDGVIPDDQRRCCKQFTWPPPKENYAYEALQGALAQAVILSQAGYTEVWNWSEQALFRAFRWLNDVAQYPAEGDDTWQPYLINYYYGTKFETILPSRPGKNVGFTDWTHGNNEAANK